MIGPTIYYVRHGQTDWNAQQRFQGQKDIPLNDTGREQARQNGLKLAELLIEPERFQYISSPLSRASETMEIIRDAIGLDKSGFIFDERLKEVSYGTLEGTTQAELKAANRELYYYRKQNAWTFRPDGGESHEDVLERVGNWYKSLEQGGLYVVTAHGAIGRVLRHYLTGIATDEVAKYPFPQNKVFLFQDGIEQLF